MTNHGLLPKGSPSSPTEVGQKLEFVLFVRHKVPSLNALFGMHPWSRYKEKRSTQVAFLSALKAAAEDSSIQTICAENGFAIQSAIADLSATIEHKTSRSEFLKQRSKQKPKKERES